MAGTFSQTYGPQMAGSFVQVASQFLGQSIVDSILKQFPARKTQRGDAYMDGGRHLLRTNIELIDPEDQTIIELVYDAAKETKEKLEESKGSKSFQRFLIARDYKCRSKEFFVVVKNASDRGIDDSLLSQLRKAAAKRAGKQPQAGRQSPGGSDPPADPFDDPPAPPLFRSPVDSIEEIELTTYESERTGDVAAAMTLRGRDDITQDVFAVFPREVSEADITDYEGTSITAISASDSNILRGIVEEEDM